MLLVWLYGENLIIVKSEKGTYRGRALIMKKEFHKTRF